MCIKNELLFFIPEMNTLLIYKFFSYSFSV